jgi:CHAT domain-containing protein
MPASRIIFGLLFTAFAVAQSPSAHSQPTPANHPPLFQTQIAEHEQKLAEARKSKSIKDQGTELAALGNLYRQVGDTQKALDDLNEELQLWRRANSQNGQALALNDLGRVYADLGQDQKALDFYDQALPLWRAAHNLRGEALTLNNKGKTYSDMGQEEKALEACNQALPIWREAGSRGSGEASTYNTLGKIYSELGEKQKSLEAYKQALPLWNTDEPGGPPLTLNNIGRVYSDLNQKQSALDYYNQALVLWRTIGDPNGEALTLGNIGRIYSELGETQRALDYYNQELPIWHATHDRRGEASALTYLGISSATLGQARRALDFYSQALPIWREVGNRSGEASTLTYIGIAYSDLKLPQNVLPNEIAALSLAKQVGDPDLQGKIEASLMRYFRDQKNPETAILFGTQAVNSFQQVRKNITGLDKDIQSSFAQSRSSAYRQLAELLVQTDRLAEAERVLDLLKEEELKEVVRGAADNPAAKVEPLPLTAPQQKAQADLATPEKTAIALTDVSMEYATLLAKPTRTTAEESRMKQLDARIEAGNGEVSAFFKNTLYPELAQKTNTTDANSLLSKEKSEVSHLQNTLADLGPRVLGIRLLLGEDHAYAIVITAHTREKVELKATPADLRSKVLQVRDDLRTPTSNPKPHLAELYAMVAAPLEPELKALESQPAQAHLAQAPVPTLLWSLDGVLRYVPMSALYDGAHYLAERFNNVLFTPESYGHMTTPAAAAPPNLRVLAMGLSKSYGGLPALPGVMPELEAVVHDPAVPTSHGPMSGVLLNNDQFTLAALKTQLGAGTTFPVVHIASHFVVETGASAEPYLMLGGDTSGDAQGYPLTLSKIEDSTISFHGTHLLTLSACSTAKGDAAQDGQEIDSLGMIAQQKDAEAVLATLWDVNDASTSRLMSDFYTRWLKSPALGKAEALRQAQLALLHNAAAPPQPAKSSRGLIITDEATTAQQPTQPHPSGYAHPYYWAPFVLIGNFQ